MNTPAHVAASLLVWRRQERPSAVVAVVAGALLPDIAMFGFYAYQRLWAGQPEREIWSTLYFDEGWQLLFDLMNSFPLALAALLVCRWRKWSLGTLCAASVLLHLSCDLPVHHDDAHRHFLPLTDWRFVSPISYWDPHYYGNLFGPLELLFSVGSCLYLTMGRHPRPVRIAAGVILFFGLVGLAFAMVMWK